VTSATAAVCPRQQTVRAFPTDPVALIIVASTVRSTCAREERKALVPLTLVNRPASLPGIPRRGTGWLPPPVDPRDFTAAAPEIRAETDCLETKLKAHKLRAFSAPPKHKDLRQWCSPIEDQGALGSCTANAAAGIVEYFERKAHGTHLDASRLFVYKTTRNLMGVTGDTGAWLRNAMGALATCGAPSERYWPYTDQAPDFDVEPPAFVYAVADNFEAVKYFAHDPLAGNVPRPEVVASVKKYLAANIPSMFGFWGYASFSSGGQPEHIPLPTDAELAGDPEWGHAVVAVGYDDNLQITNTVSSKTTKGAFLIRNSWGTGWGDAGYGWMPYDYTLAGVALDYWSLLSLEWLSTDQFYF
jgi:C1A family cysteine protease